MAQGTLVAAIVITIIAVVLALIAVTISGIISLRVTDTDTKKRLQAISALGGFGVILGAVAAVFGILYGRAKASQSKSTKGLMIAFIVLAVITLLMFVTIIALIFSVRGREGIDQTNGNALLASIFLLAGAFIGLTVGAILFFTLTKGKSGKEALQSITLQKRSASVSPSNTSMAMSPTAPKSKQP